MKCPNCEGDIDATLMNVAHDAAEGGIEVRFCCPYCRKECYTFLNTWAFVAE